MQDATYGCIADGRAALLAGGNAQSPNCSKSELELVLFRRLVEHGGGQPVGLFFGPLSVTLGAIAIPETFEPTERVADESAVDGAIYEGDSGYGLEVNTIILLDYDLPLSTLV